ncbi:MAG: hybrid sensor histidine kinase/response regulator, partial [Phycisphaerae bacterium]|nr:hybrid sensor histidine kinase/response regulator [Phycisphaerae bacterium]
ELKAIFDSLNQPVLVFNDLGKPVRANRAAYELLAADPCALNPDAYVQLSNVLRTRHLDGSLVDPTDLPSRRALLGETVKGEQLMLTNAKGRDIIIETAGIPLRVSGRLIGAVAVWNDITERTRIERERELLLASERAARCEAEHANRVKDEFVATLSHELRTPLNAILGWAQLLRRGRPDPEDVKEALEVIQSNALAQKQLIDDLLDVSRMMSGKIRLNRRALNVSHAAAEALASIRPQAEEKGLRLEEAIEHEAGCVQADPERLQQILWNLLSNAVKFTPAGGQIRFAVERQGQNAVLTVSDTGIGIRPEFLPSLFERFRQADASTTRRYRGLGLGLSLVKQLVDLHGGSISASSPGENQGTTFTLTLPLIIGPVMECPATAAGGGGDDGEPETTLQGLRVLIVDDLADARELLSRLFREYSAAPIAVASAAAALEQIRKAPPDVLVSDISMPDEDGYSLISKVRALPAERLARIPAIAVTAFARPEDRNQAIRAGFQAHVSKPVDPAELIALVAGLSGRTPRRKKA